MKSTEWIFQDLLVIRLNHTAREMMCSIEIPVKHRCGLIFLSTQGQDFLAKDCELNSINGVILPNSLARSCAQEADSRHLNQDHRPPLR